ncbi:MAG: tetratricopeptide repeat protein [Ignavibacteriae bacterium]|nr:tetratricopeptide repeat protein [Ignavibacteriota bacterium]MCB9206169.1 tetratricopeptide repeat protein [Ignavibacteriales bacterium]MCB9210843.1 tetratricopeptide repeat protein [Ignavibacteriales bacterium]MCB9217861.1 tetratricopeptide repeat protein [Ignavibacteriales bacterium]
MKRVLSIILLLSIALGFSAFQCSSTELTSAKLYIQQKNYDKAIESLQKEVEKNPKSDEGFYLLGFVLGEQGDISGMLDNFSKSSQISTKFAKNIEESKRYHWADGFNKGVQLFNRGAKAGDTDSANVIFQQAIDKFNGAIQCQPDSADTYKNLAYAYINMGDRDAAIEPYKKVVELSKSEDAYVSLGDLYVQKAVMLKDSGKEEEGNKSFNEAIKILEEGRKEHPMSGDILLLLSNSYIGANKLDVAKDAFKDGVLQDPENKFYRYNYGSLLLNAEEYPEAAAQLEKALEIDGEYENALYNLAVTYVKWGANMREEMEAKGEESEEYKAKFEAALPLLEKYLTIKEDEGAVWDLLGKVYANLGMSEKSKNAFEKADLYR